MPNWVAYIVIGITTMVLLGAFVWTEVDDAKTDLRYVLDQIKINNDTTHH